MLKCIGRRDFLGRSVAVVGGAVALRGLGLAGGLAPGAARAAGGPRTLVLLRLYGGNDGLNTVIPYGAGEYYDNRPTLGVPVNQVLQLNGTVGLHPRMTAMKSHFDAGRLAVIQSVGYPDPNLSHFRSEVIWQSADPVGITPTGWVGRWLDAAFPAGDESVRAVDVNYYLQHVLLSDHANVFAFPNLDRLGFPTDYAYGGDIGIKRATFETAAQAARAAGSPAEALARGGYVLSRNVDLYAAVQDGIVTTFPDTRLGDGFRTVARMIQATRNGDTAAAVFQVGIDGFDTHAQQNQQGGHADLWGDIDASLAAFHAELTAMGAADDVVVLVYSEFGRRVEENGSRGTDHGTAAPMFAFGNPVTGGVYGPDADLVNLDGGDNLVHEVDFREVYSTIIERWLGGDSSVVLNGTYTPIPFLPVLP